jgi:hypothetical protein
MNKRITHANDPDFGLFDDWRWELALRIEQVGFSSQTFAGMVALRVGDEGSMPHTFNIGSC